MTFHRKLIFIIWNVGREWYPCNAQAIKMCTSSNYTRQHSPLGVLVVAVVGCWLAAAVDRDPRVTHALVNCDDSVSFQANIFIISAATSQLLSCPKMVWYITFCVWNHLWSLGTVCRSNLCLRICFRGCCCWPCDCWLLLRSQYHCVALLQKTSWSTLQY